LDATILELQQAISSGRLTSVELVDSYLARIAAYDRAGPKVNALITVNPAAREEAVALDAERAASGPRGPLHGIPVVLKDNISTADIPTNAGSLAMEVPALGGRLPGAQAPRGGRDHHRQGEHVRVRPVLGHDVLPWRPDAQPL
jgi:hypothetical protein